MLSLLHVPVTSNHHQVENAVGCMDMTCSVPQYGIPYCNYWTCHVHVLQCL